MAVRERSTTNEGKTVKSVKLLSDFAFGSRLQYFVIQCFKCKSAQLSDLGMSPPEYRQHKVRHKQVFEASGLAKCFNGTVRGDRFR